MLSVNCKFIMRIVVRLLLLLSVIGCFATRKIYLRIFCGLLWMGWTVVRILILLNYI